MGEQEVVVDKIRELGNDGGGSMRFLPSTKQIFATKLVSVPNRMYNINGACTNKIDNDLVTDSCPSWTMGSSTVRAFAFFFSLVSHTTEGIPCPLLRARRW
jgi:hypothetical protein